MKIKNDSPSKDIEHETKKDVKKIILASTSPYRKKLMTQVTSKFTTIKPLCDESELKELYNGSPKKLCMYLAKEKALSISTVCQKSLIIGSDQSLFFGDLALGKGKNFDGAQKQLSMLSGKEALLVTAVYIHDTNGEDLFFECNTQLKFKNLTAEEITSYLQKDQPYDCAGSFKFEENGHSLFEEVTTEDMSSIQGLPIKKLKEALQQKNLI